jgi:hypothetical protein
MMDLIVGSGHRPAVFDFEGMAGLTSTVVAGS